MNADVVIVGGSVVGCNAAINLRNDGFRGRIVVVERDFSYSRASAYLAMGGIRQQFCTPVTVQMVQHSLHVWTAMEPARFRQRGYLFLADPPRAASAMQRFEAERRAGARVQLLSREDIRAIVPDLMLDDVVFGVLGPQDGYAAPREALRELRRIAEQSAEFIQDEVTGLEVVNGAIDAVKLASGAAIKTAKAVNATGAWSGAIGRMAGLDVPVTPMRQMLFRATLPQVWSYRFPMVIDPGGVHWRHEDPSEEGAPDRIIVAFTKWDEPVGENFAPATERWEREFFPALVRRLPAFRDLTAVEGWSGLYEMTPDHNPVLGEHPRVRGLVFASGFSGHGLMMSPATGKIVSEFVREGRSTTFDVAIFAPDRFERGALVHDAATI